eukprot:TRINITY_DN564_c0_g1_i12.p1 TRINITY_DN564_c0_g1~~TRINITY_DN564_c0_g1_i12.p1  ORF type:complete len:740 (+),score=200.99 TRINITY_DN564_c0_g1_i12:88-2307(+)
MEKRLNNIPPYQKQQTTLDSPRAREKWKVLEDAIHEIYMQNPGKLSFQNLYTTGYHLVLHRHGEMLYAGVEGTLKKHVGEMARRVKEVSDDGFLMAVVEKWQSHSTAVGMVRDILMYMDKNYAPKQKLSVPELGVAVFGDIFLKDKEITARIKRLTTEIIEKERSGERPPERQLLKSVTTVMYEVSRRTVYEPLLEHHFIESSREYYIKEASETFQSLSTPEYFKNTFRRMAEERERVERCLADSTLPKILNVIKDQMLKQYATHLIERESSGVRSMLESWRLPELSLTFKALQMINTTQLLLDIIKDYLVTTGSKYIQDPANNENPVALVEGVMKMREAYDELLDHACTVETAKGGQHRDRVFEKEIKQAFVLIVNKNPRFAEYLSIAIDTKLRKKRTVEDEYDTYFDKVIILFQYLKDKDIFEKYHKGHLARRLLIKGSACEEGELCFITKLKTEAGHQFTTKIEGMFNDMTVSKGNMDAFSEHVGPRAGVDISVHVLTTGFWPFTNAVSEALPLPPPVEALREKFHDFYLASHSGRRLTWLYHMGTAEVKCFFNGRKYEANVHTLQMLILNLFNQRDSMTLGAIHEQTLIPMQELKKQILSLSINTKVYQRLLIKDCPGAKGMDEETVLSVNQDFSSRHMKFKVSAVLLKETDEQAQETRAKIGDDRKWQLDAVIVRVMKSRKVIDHRELITEVVTLLQPRFAPSPEDIKKRIESLIEREYIERSPDARTTYVYLA